MVGELIYCGGGEDREVGRQKGTAHMEQLGNLWYRLLKLRNESIELIECCKKDDESALGHNVFEVSVRYKHGHGLSSCFVKYLRVVSFCFLTLWRSFCI